VLRLRSTPGFPARTNSSTSSIAIIFIIAALLLRPLSDDISNHIP
jgi:hypothetical protein